MADEPKDHPEDIQGILSDLDAILSGIGAPPPAEAAPPKPVPVKPPEDKPVPAPKPVEPPKPAEAAKPVEPPKVSPKAAPPPAETPVPNQETKIELAPRAGFIPPPPKKPESPKLEPVKPAETPKPAETLKPAETPKPVEPPKPAAPPTPAVPAAPKAAVPGKPGEPPPPAAAAVEDIPPSTPKDQIRRVAYVYTFSCAEARASFAAYLSQAARTISKKPIFLRQVMAAELTASSDPFAVFEKARDVKAVAMLAVVEGWPPAKVDGLSDACARGGLLFRAISPADVQKKSTAVDVIVDMMLLSGEA